MKFIPACVALLLALTGCASSNIPVTPEIRRDLHTIGIISAVGERITYQRVSTAGFVDSRTQRDSSSWGLDALVVDLIKSSIQQKYTVVEVPPINLPRGSAPLSAEQLVALDRERRATPLDAYLVLKSVEVGDFITGSSRPVAGLGIYYAWSFGIEAYASCTMFLVDGQNSKAFAGAALRMDAAPSSFGDRLVSRRPPNTFRRPHKPIDDSIAKAETWDALTPAQLKVVEDALKGILREGIPLTLRDLQLIP